MMVNDPKGSIWSPFKKTSPFWERIERFHVFFHFKKKILCFPSHIHAHVHVCLHIPTQLMHPFMVSHCLSLSANLSLAFDKLPTFL